MFHRRTIETRGVWSARPLTLGRFHRTGGSYRCERSFDRIHSGRRDGLASLCITSKRRFSPTRTQAGVRNATLWRDRIADPFEQDARWEVRPALLGAEQPDLRIAQLQVDGLSGEPDPSVGRQPGPRTTTMGHQAPPIVAVPPIGQIGRRMSRSSSEHNGDQICHEMAAPRR